MQTKSELIAYDMTLFNKSKTMMDKLNVIRWGLFGAYEYTIGKYHFEQKNRFYWKPFGPQDWHMTVNGKTTIIPYRYVLALTYKAMGLI